MPEYPARNPANASFSASENAGSITARAAGDGMVVMGYLPGAGRDRKRPRQRLTTSTQERPVHSTRAGGISNHCLKQGSHPSAELCANAVAPQGRYPACRTSVLGHGPDVAYPIAADAGVRWQWPTFAVDPQLDHRSPRP